MAPNGQQGIYRAAIGGSQIKVADLNTAIPGGSGKFTSFIPQEPFAPAIDGTSVAFFGAGSVGQQGVYVSIPQEPFIPVEPVRIADTSTAIPGGTGNFTGFGPVSLSATDVAFLGLGSNGQQGIYDMTGGTLLKVVDLSDIVDSRPVASLHFSPSGLSGSTLAFEAMFVDGSQGLYTWSRPGVAGDFNGDGKVDAADYVVWRKSDGTPAGYSSWRANYGQASGSSAALASSESLSTEVPELPTVILLLTGLPTGGLLRRIVRFDGGHY